MTGGLLVVFLACLLAAFVIAAFEWIRVIMLVGQWLLLRCGSTVHRNPDSSGDAGPSCASPLGDDDIAANPQSTEGTSTDFQCCSWKSVGGPGALATLPVLSPSLAAIDPSPNFEAFASGIELMVFTALFTIGALLVLNWIIKTMRGGQ